MLGLDLAVGYALAYLRRTVSRAAGRTEREADPAVDSAMAHVHRLVAAAVGDDRLLEAVSGQAGGGGADADAARAVREQIRHIRPVLARALHNQPARTLELERALLEVRRALETSGAAATAAGAPAGAARAHGGAVARDTEIRADHGGVAAQQIRDVTVTNPWSPGARAA
jgi:hypothetical protein